jgi:hypothetical protein
MFGNVTLNPHYVDLLDGDHLAALMLSQIVYWYKPGKDGKAKINLYKRDQYWLAKSHKEWFEELRLTRFQSQRCLAKLKEKGLITTELMRFDGSPTVHIRLNGVHGNRLPNDWRPAMDCVDTSNGLPVDQQTLTEITTETTAETTKAGAGFALPGLSPLAKDEPGESGNSASGDTNPEGSLEEAAPINKKTSKEQAMATVAEILKKQAEKSKGVTPNTKAGLYYLWQKRMASITGGFSKELTLKEKGQLGQYLTKAGESAGEALDFALNNWNKFTHAVQKAKGQASSPDLPVPGYVLANYDVLLQLIAQKPVQAKPVGVVKPAPAPVVKPEPVVEDKPTAEQIAADLAFFSSKS